MASDVCVEVHVRANIDKASVLVEHGTPAIVRAGSEASLSAAAVALPLRRGHGFGKMSRLSMAVNYRRS